MSHLSIPQKDIIMKFWKKIQDNYNLDIQRWIQNPIPIQFNLTNKDQLDLYDILGTKITFETALKYLQQLLKNEVIKASKISDCKEKEIAEKIWFGTIKNTFFINKKKLLDEIKIKTAYLTQEETIYILKTNWVDTTDLICIIQEHYKNKKIAEIVDQFLKQELENYETVYIEKMKEATLALELPYISKAKTSEQIYNLICKFKDLRYDTRVIKFLETQMPTNTTQL